MSAVPVIETLFKPLNKDKVRALYQEQQKQAIKYLENEDMPFNECANALRKGLEIVNLAYYYFPQEFKKDYKQYRAFVEKIKLFPVASIEKESAAAKEKIDSIHQFLKREVTQPIVLYVPPSDSTHTLLVTACEQFSKTDPSYAVFYVDFSSFYSLQDETEINAKYVTILKAFYQQYEQYIKDVDIKEIFQDDQALINHKQPLVILAKEILKRSGKKIILFIHGIDLIEINEKLEILRRLAAIDICFEKSIAIAAARKVRAWEVWKNQQTIYLTNETKGNMKKTTTSADREYFSYR